jgi:hypothetical protein
MEFETSRALNGSFVSVNTAMVILWFSVSGKTREFVCYDSGIGKRISVLVHAIAYNIDLPFSYILVLS